MARNEFSDEDHRRALEKAVSKRELTPKYYDPKDPQNPVILRYQSCFLNFLATAENACVSDALAEKPFHSFKTYGPSPQLDEALSEWAVRFKINLKFVIEAARKTLARWARQPSTLARKSWALSSPDFAFWEWTPREGDLVKTKVKRERDERHRYIAFEWLVWRHVFDNSSVQIAKLAQVDYRDVDKQIKWAAIQLGIRPSKLKQGRPKGAKTKFVRGLLKTHITPCE